MKNRKRKRIDNKVDFVLLLIFLAIGLYESFAPVYLCGMLITFILEGTYQKQEVKFLKLLESLDITSV